MKNREKQVLMAILRPLLFINNKRNRLIFVGRHYFDMSIEDICSLFNIKRREVYHILQQCRNILKTLDDKEILKAIENDDTNIPSFDVLL